MGSREREREIAEGLKTKIKASVGGGERVRGKKKAESGGEAQTEAAAGGKSSKKSPITSGPV